MSRSRATTAVEIRPAGPDDADAIVDVVRSGFSPAELDLMIYGCAGVQRFVALQIERTDGGSDTRYTVALDEERRVVGCVELRVSPSGVVLNYISVDPMRRASGVGRRMLLAALQALPGRADVISLDVLERNTAASGWYERLGFERRSIAEWWSFPLGDAVAANGRPAAAFSGYPQAAVCHEAFGFSQVSLATSSGSYAVGRIGDRWLRLTDPAALSDPEVPPALRHLAVDRILLIAGPAPIDAALAARATLKQRTHRMTAGLDTVRAALH